ncbi:UNVERIFIED_CONTAM: hypothetical protein RMT77_000392 [Armadillidium vulgare]
MDVDEDLDAGLLRQFNCLNTNDKEALMRQLQNLIGVHLNEQTARFYLDMTDWNLQAAVCAYFDLQSANKLPQMTFLKDITIGEGESVPPNTRFVKTWKIKNNGDDSWPNGCQLIYTGGDRMGAPSQVSINPLLPGHEAEISVEMISPMETGLYSSKWRLSTPQGNFFGDTIWVILQVDSGGTLALMQQMVNLKELGSSPPTSDGSIATSNPFGNSSFLSRSSSNNIFNAANSSENSSSSSNSSSFPSMNARFENNSENRHQFNGLSNDIEDTPMT